MRFPVMRGLSQQHPTGFQSFNKTSHYLRTKNIMKFTIAYFLLTLGFVAAVPTIRINETRSADADGVNESKEVKIECSSLRPANTTPARIARVLVARQFSTAYSSLDHRTEPVLDPSTFGGINYYNFVSGGRSV
jgi:hypothetical protein